MVRYLLNSAVIASEAYGTYVYGPLNWAELKAFLEEGPFESRVGYDQTARAIEDKTGIPITLSREMSVLEPGDCAAIVRLKCRVADPTSKGAQVPIQEWDLGIMKRIA